MIIFIFIALLILGFIALVLFLKHYFFTRHIIKQFEKCNVIVAGKKGSGKDLLFQWVINKRKQSYYANIDYGNEYHYIGLKQVSCEPNDYSRIVNDAIEKQDHTIIEGRDIYISDIGIFLPSYMDSTLYKKFPSMPIFYALSRHLYNNNVHCNTQNIERGWKALREQADYYIICKRTTKIFGFLITKIYAYDNYNSAKQGLKPVKARLLNKYSKAEADIYNAQVGEIKTGHIIQRVSSLKYDTRAFEKILLKGERLYDE